MMTRSHWSASAALKTLGRGRRLYFTSFLACCCFVALAIYGWGLSWKDVLQFSLVLLVLLLALVLAAALLGWILYRLRRLRSRQ